MEDSSCHLADNREYLAIDIHNSLVSLGSGMSDQHGGDEGSDWRRFSRDWLKII